MPTKTDHNKKHISSNTFNIDFQYDKVYLLQVSPHKYLQQARLNNTTIKNSYNHDNKVFFNVTELLKDQNKLELNYSQHTDFTAKIHYLNKLYIPAIALSCNTAKKIIINVRVKNAFNTEKQGVLEYTLYSAEGKKLHTRETPVFIAGNSGNSYQQEIQIELEETAIDGVRVVCSLYSNNMLFDEISDDL